MGRKKKKQFDFMDAWQEEPATDDDINVMPEVDKVTLRDFVVEVKVQAFVNAYVPCDECDAGYEQFDDDRLRQVFKAYVCALGDPLKLYLEDLKAAGFRMQMSVLGEPAIFAVKKG